MNKFRHSLLLRVICIAILVIFLCFTCQILIAMRSIRANVEARYETIGLEMVKYAAETIRGYDQGDQVEMTELGLDVLLKTCHETDIDYCALEAVSEDGNHYYPRILVADTGIIWMDIPESVDEWFELEEKDKHLKNTTEENGVWHRLTDLEQVLFSPLRSDVQTDTHVPDTLYYLVFSRVIEDNSSGITSFARVWIATDRVLKESWRELFRTTGIGLLISVVLLFFLMRYVYRKVFSPVRKISAKMISFVNGTSLDQGSIPVRGNDEIAQMARSYNTMTENIRNYVSEIDTMTRNREEMNAELKITAQIQEGLLPGSGYSNPYISISSMMKPARYVGGDFYDYFELDNNRVCMVIADVSGKGITAAMFMSSAVMMMRYIASSGIHADITPAQILEKVNNDLNAHNNDNRFITVFVVIFNPADMTLVYSNAGHNPPYLVNLQADQMQQPLTGTSGFPLGVFRDETYKDTVVSITPGSFLFMYTDGVTEAVSPNKTFFGEARLEKVLKSVKTAPADTRGTRDTMETMDSVVIQEVSSALTAFVDNNEQFDDITMLCAYFKPHIATPDSDIVSE